MGVIAAVFFLIALLVGKPDTGGSTFWVILGLIFLALAVEFGGYVRERFVRR
jgi:hypothetical protein